jgi:glycine/D-amino acid oxidase-like deaminating enzyme
VSIPLGHLPIVVIGAGPVGLTADAHLAERPAVHRRPGPLTVLDVAAVSDVQPGACGD